MNKLVAFLLIGLGVSGAACATNLVANPGMELPMLSGGYHTFSAGESFGGWTVSEHSIDLCATDTWQAAEGSQSVDLGGSPGPGVIYQDLAVAAGQTYRLQFAMAGDPFWAGIKEMKVYWAEGLVADLIFDTTPYSADNMGWTYHSYSVTASGTTARLRFEDVNHTDGYYGAALDDVSVVAIPEPCSLLALAGGVIALLHTRRRRS
jgi:choice-of-anchor C domain-containing protein